MKTDRDSLLRKQAFEDFCMLPARGRKASINQLHDYYITLNQEQPELRPTIPTTTRSTIYAWAKEDEWERRYAEREAALIDKNREAYDNLRSNGYGKLSLLIEDSVETLQGLLRETVDPKVRLQAAEAILDRMGLVRQTAKAGAKGDAVAKPEAATSDAPPIDADDDVVLKWLSETGGSSINA